MARSHGASRPINFAAGLLATGPLYYRGFSLQSTAGATIVLYDNASAGSGTVLEVINLAAGESAREFYALDGTYAVAGVYTVVTGTATGSIRVNT